MLSTVKARLRRRWRNASNKVVVARVTLHIRRHADSPNTLKLALTSKGTALAELTVPFKLAVSVDLGRRIQREFETRADDQHVSAGEGVEPLGRLGEALFQAVFGAPDTRQLWEQIQPDLSQLHVEVRDAVSGAAPIPWEAMRDPSSTRPLASICPSFVRRPELADEPEPADLDGEGPLRVLVVSARPEGLSENMFRSGAQTVAHASEVSGVEWSFLRPATFSGLTNTLLEAESLGEPFHVVHFEGAAIKADIESDSGERIATSDWSLPEERQEGARPYLLLDNRLNPDQLHLADGLAVAELLAEAHTPLAVLSNCCLQGEAGGKSSGAGEAADADQASDEASPKERLSFESPAAFHSIGQEMADLDLAAVVTLPYPVDFEACERRLAKFYDRLARGAWLSEAVAAARDLTGANDGGAFSNAVGVYGAQPLRIMKPMEEQEGRLRSSVEPRGQLLDPALPPSSELGFFGRNGLISELDRAFQSQSTVLLYGPPGAGKTDAAAEFARWYSGTGGINGPTIYTSLRRHRRFQSVLDQLARCFRAVLNGDGTAWERLTEEERLETATHLLKQTAVFWIFDDVHHVTAGAWSDIEQGLLFGFIEAVGDSQAKVLLTSRGPRDDVLEAARRVEATPLQPGPCVRLASAVAERMGGPCSNATIWKTLGENVHGNPLAVRILAAQAIRDGRDNQQAIAQLVGSVVGGTAEETVANAAKYGIENALEPQDREALAGVAAFDCALHPTVLNLMGRQEAETSLRRAAALGLLRPLSDGSYCVEAATAEAWQALSGRQEAAPDEAFLSALKSLSESCDADDVGSVEALERIEPTLRRACELARKNDSTDELIAIASGLGTLYAERCYPSAWKDLGDFLEPLCTDPETKAAIPGEEALWREAVRQKVELAMKTSSVPQALLLQNMATQAERTRVKDFLGRPANKLNRAQKTTLASFAETLHRLASVQRLDAKPSHEAEDQAFELAMRAEAFDQASVWCLETGASYTESPSIKNLDRAELWLKRGFELADDRPALRAKLFALLGQAFWQRFREDRRNERPVAELKNHLTHGLRSYEMAIEHTRNDDPRRLSELWLYYGHVHYSMGQIERAIPHYRQSIRYDVENGDACSAARTRFNIAIALRDLGRLGEARRYATQAYNESLELGGLAPENIVERSRRLIQLIERALFEKREARQRLEEARQVRSA